MKYLILVLALSGTQGRNFIEDPKCPAVTPQGSCQGRRSNCWSPGVRDTDCPGHGLCCYDGCANTCVSDILPAASIQQPQFQPTPVKLQHPPPPPQNSYFPPPPPPTPVTSPAPSYIPPPPQPIQTPAPSYIPPLDPFEDRQQSVQVQVTQPAPRPTQPTPRPTQPTPRPNRPTQPPRQPAHVGGSCPASSPLPLTSCLGRFSTCWSVGVSDLDCPNWGLCCFDGCANTCVGSNPPPSPPTESPIPRYEPPRNPCDPNPCGPGSMCIPQEGEPECKCPPGLVPNPTPQQGCIVPNPCDPNPCGPGSMCIPQEGKPTCKCPEGLVPDPTPEIKCSVRDPCNPSPCGPGTTCTPNRDGNPICTCLPGLIPKPDTITGCGPECVVDPDCKYGFICSESRCVEKPDPCNPSPCGPGTTCTPNRDGNPICTCIPGLIPKPDTITGCGPECLVDPDCRFGYICSERRCVEKPDPCVPNPCGEGAVCILQGDSFSCECPAGTVGNGNTGCYRGECIVDADCSSLTACQDYNCVDPCLSGTCSSTDFCKVREHIPICGFNYDPPPPEPKDEFVIGERYEPRTPQESRPQVVIGARHELQPVMPDSRNPFIIGGTDTRSPGLSAGARDAESMLLMMMMDTSRLPVIGASFNRRRRSLLRTHSEPNP